MGPYDWLHGQLEEDGPYLAKWSGLLSTRLDYGIHIDDAEFFARRLRGVALKDTMKMKISINAGASLTFIARSLQGVCTLFRATYPNGDAIRVELGTLEDPAHLSRSLVTVAHAGEDRTAVLRSNYWKLRHEARVAYERCHDTETITDWHQLYGAWFQALIAERIVHLSCPASTRDAAGPDPRVKELFSEDEQVTLEKMDAELKEGVADIVTALALWATDEAQNIAHTEVLRSYADDGRPEARKLLREMRRDFRVAPWNLKAWDAELTQMGGQGAETRGRR